MGKFFLWISLNKKDVPTLLPHHILFLSTIISDIPSGTKKSRIKFFVLNFSFSREFVADISVTVCRDKVTASFAVQITCHKPLCYPHTPPPPSPAYTTCSLLKHTHTHTLYPCIPQYHCLTRQSQSVYSYNSSPVEVKGGPQKIATQAI